MKLLLIMPNFFNYPEVIIKELNNMGYEVDFFDDRPSTNAWIKAIIRIKKNLINIYIKKYFKKIMETVGNKEYDVVFFISGQSLSLSENMIGEIKNCQNKARFVLYQWDSQTNFPFVKNVQRFFDKCYSFDSEDVKETSVLEFLPLFYSSMYEKLGEKNGSNFKYDICFVGTAHPKKYKFVSMICEQLKNVYSNQFIYFFLPSSIVYFYRKIINKEFRKACYNEFHYTPLSSQEMNNIYESSKCILDSAQDGQSGLTIRVIEALGAKKKLITTNENIINYDFYRPENIYIYNGEIDVNNIFFQSKYVDIDDKIYKKYSLQNWLKVIIE